MGYPIAFGFSSVLTWLYHALHADVRHPLRVDRRHLGSWASCEESVPTKKLESIFKPFFGLDRVRDGASGGMGLGLAIAQRAIQLHNGEVWAENAEPGLRVSVSLPAGARE